MRQNYLFILMMFVQGCNYDSHWQQFEVKKSTNVFSDSPRPSSATLDHCDRLVGENIVVIHGWGGGVGGDVASSIFDPRDLSPASLVKVAKKIWNWSNLSQLIDLVSCPDTTVHIIRYNFRAHTMQEIIADVGDQLKRALSGADSSVIVAHSMGQHVGLRALLSENLQGKVKLLIGLAGIAHGQINDFTGAHSIVAKSFVLRAIKKYLPEGEYLGPIKELYEKLVAEEFESWFDPAKVAAINKCSAFSNADDVVNNPYDSGSFSIEFYQSVRLENKGRDLFFYDQHHPHADAKSITSKVNTDSFLDQSYDSKTIPWSRPELLFTGDDRPLDFHYAVKSDPALIQRVFSECLK